ncbi:hypothetical protein LIER_43830 [Lithospermum erythrorhizon]|uniref:Phytocyanin domain-containing protein n=1 Tax=Lithospermum erythrorhizon TaxID=34254 RepID=A0AAV3QY25_LITER
MEGAYNCVFLVVAIVTVIMGRTLASKYVVGGSQGWDESTDFNSWSSGQTFKVGDELVFKYSSGLHSVNELADEKAYKSCDVGSSLKSLNSGSDTIKLDKAGTRYFACGTSGHCDAGMKVKITTGNGGGSSSTTTSSSQSVHVLGPFYVIASLLPIQMVLFVLLA